MPELISVKKIAVWAYVLVGLGGLLLLVVIGPADMAVAIEPTPTPVMRPDRVDEPDSIRCRLELGANCDFVRPGDITVSTLITHTNPPLAAQDVPTYTLVSITFVDQMDAGTINSDTFYVSQDTNRVSGSVEYLASSRMAVFYPDVPLQPATRYTATVAGEVRYVTGVPLAKKIEWTFTTFVEPVRIGGDISATGAPIGSGMSVYFGDLHTHSGYVDDFYLPGTPAEAFTVARANGLEFMALTGHDTHLNEARWQDILAQANAATTEGTFIGLRGFEFTHSSGHLNVLETDSFVTWADPRYRNLVDFYAWLVAQPGAIGEFNHPKAGLNFNNFAFNATADQKIVLREILNVNQTLLSLNQGWHVGTLLNSDTHKGEWGQQKYMGVVAPGLTRAAILEAIRARRTFYVPPDGQRFAVVMKANGYWMGSAIPKTGAIDFDVTVYDPNHGGQPVNLALYDNGVWVANARLPGKKLVSWSPTLPAKLGHYYYVAAYHDDWYFPAYSSPIWVERAPVANAGLAQMAAPGAVVSLDGSASWDPDGDTLAYQWVQKSGATVSWQRNDVVQPVFTAPATLGQLEFDLTVIDTGNLSDVDRTTVTITDQPILSIGKSGPKTVEPGELITYTLAVTNDGITPATGVVITDAVPAGATYVSGGTLMPGNIVSWTVPSLTVSGGVTQVTFVVTSSGGIANSDYRVSSAEGVFAVGRKTIFTNWRELYLPVIMKVH